MAGNLRHKKRLDYRLMNEGTKLDQQERIKKREVLPDLYNVERIVSVKNCQKEGKLYLVKWCGYGDNDCTWEPHHHLPLDVIDHFLKPTVSEETVRIYSSVFEESVRQRLKSRRDVFCLTFPFELYRFAFSRTTEFLAQKEDFDKLNLKKHWDVMYRNNGVGMALKFPVRITPVVRYVNNFVPVDGKMVNQKHLLERLRVTSSTGVVFADSSS